ncbi:hypothetical protein R1A27_04810 [Methylobacterium sp. NMS12]|uniref:DUF6894 family protein n=1 Tax=Methylobacterium sp. NMS12 TaxID=3079766 RepID=UPI003F88147B
MPRYFIDIHDGTQVIRDKEGCELSDLEAARGQAVRIMTRITQRLSDEPGRQDFVVAVRNADGVVRMRLRLSLDAGPVE